MCLIPNKTRPSSAGAAAAATVPGGGLELGPPRGLSPGGGRREVVVRGCAVPIQASKAVGRRCLAAQCRMGSLFITSSAAPWGRDGAGAGCRAGFQLGQRGSPCQQPLGMDTRMDVCWEDVELLGVRPGCGCCRAWGYREGVGAARPPTCLCGTAGARGAAHRARRCPGLCLPVLLAPQELLAEAHGGHPPADIPMVRGSVPAPHRALLMGPWGCGHRSPAVPGHQ